MSALEQVPEDIATLRSTVRAALDFVRSITTADEARDAYDRVKLAKEWARIRKVAKEMHRDLLTLECHLLRKAALLDALTSVPAANRRAAKWLASMTEEQMEDAIASFGDDGSPTRMMKRALGEDDYSSERQRFTSGQYATHGDSYVGDEARPDAVDAFSRDLKERLAGLLEHYYEGDEGFSVFEFAEQISDSIGLDQRSAVWGGHQGLLEVCRKAVRDAPTLVINGTEAPRFITCIDRSTAYKVALYNAGNPAWIRVPFAAATMRQLDDMVALRQEQAEKAARVAESLARLRDRLASHELPDDRRSGRDNPVTLGTLAARIAFSEGDDMPRAG